MFRILAALAALFMLPGATYYVAPTPGGVAALLAGGKVVGGDTIILQDGDHGALTIKGVAFDKPVTIRADHKGKAHVESIMIRENVRNVTIAGLSVWPSDPHTHDSALIYTWASSSAIVLRGLDVRAGIDAANYPAWTVDEWTRRKTSGAQIMGSGSVITGSRFTGVNFGVQLLGDDDRAAGNVISGFSADGMRMLGQRDAARDNVIKDCVSIDDNHADGIQSFTSPTVPLVGLVVERNQIMEWANAVASPIHCTLQGIGFFDGFYDNLSVKNNIVAVNAYHGIGLYGVRKGQVENNTVVRTDGGAVKWPWIIVVPHKNGTPSTGVTILNNMAMGYGAADVLNGVIYSDNITISDPATFFGPGYVPTAASGAIDTASKPTLKVDVHFHVRPFGAGADKGAVEAGSTVVFTPAPAP